MHRPAIVRSLLVGVLLLIAFDATAATLITGGLLGRRHRCCVVNAGTKPLLDVVPELREFDGTSAGGDNLCDAALPPGGMCCTQRSDASADVLYCAISFDGSKSAARGTLAVEEESATAVLEAH